MEEEALRNDAPTAYTGEMPPTPAALTSGTHLERDGLRRYRGFVFQRRLLSG
jgi:hypothetical protein